MNAAMTSADDAAADCAPDPIDDLFDAPAPDDEVAGGFVPTGPAVAAAAAGEAQCAAWIEAIVERDERALAALYDATFSRVFGLVRRIVRDAALAEEVVEDAYFQVWRQAVRFDPARGTALSWLLAMARSRALDALRREARYGHDALDEQEPAAIDASAAPEDELLELARHRAELHRALTALGAQPRQLVSMSFFRGLSHEEIAEQMALPLGTVKSQIRRALLALREALGEPSAGLMASRP